MSGNGKVIAVVVAVVVIAGMAIYFFSRSSGNVGNNSISRPSTSRMGVMIDYRVESWPGNAFTVLVCSDGKIGLAGKEIERNLYAEGQLSPIELSQLEEAFSNDRFFSLNDTYPAPSGSKDGGTVEITYTRGGQTKKIINSGSAPLPSVESKMLAAFRNLEAKSQGGEARGLPEDFCK